MLGPVLLGRFVSRRANSYLASRTGEFRMLDCCRLVVLRAFAAVTALALVVHSADAAIIAADFNDITVGGINGKAGGTGFTGNWTGSAGGQIVAGDLTSSLYTVTQGGTAQHYRSTNSTGLRQNYGTVTTSPAGEVWF